MFLFMLGHALAQDTTEPKRKPGDLAREIITGTVMIAGEGICRPGAFGSTRRGTAECLKGVEGLVVATAGAYAVGVAADMGEPVQARTSVTEVQTGTAARNATLPGYYGPAGGVVGYGYPYDHAYVGAMYDARVQLSQPGLVLGNK